MLTAIGDERRGYRGEALSDDVLPGLKLKTLAKSTALGFKGDVPGFKAQCSRTVIGAVKTVRAQLFL